MVWHGLEVPPPHGATCPSCWCPQKHFPLAASTPTLHPTPMLAGFDECLTGNPCPHPHGAQNLGYRLPSESLAYRFQHATRGKQQHMVGVGNSGCRFAITQTGSLSERFEPCGVTQGYSSNDAGGGVGGGLGLAYVVFNITTCKEHGAQHKSRHINPCNTWRGVWAHSYLSNMRRGKEFPKVPTFGMHNSQSVNVIFTNSQRSLPSTTPPLPLMVSLWGV